MSSEPNENTGSINKITAHLFALILYHILCLSTQFEGQVNPKLALASNTIELTSFNLCGERAALPSSNSAAGGTTLIPSCNSPTTHNRRQVRKMLSWNLAVYAHKAVQGCRNSYVRKPGIKCKHLAEVSSLKIPRMRCAMGAEERLWNLKINGASFSNSLHL